MTTPPRWDLTNVYPSLNSKEFEASVKKVKKQIGELEKFFDKNVDKTTAKTPVKKLAGLAGEAIDRFNAVYEALWTINAYIYSFVSTNSRDKLAMKKLSEFEQVGVRMQNLNTRFLAWAGKLSPVLDKVIAANPTAKAHAFMLKDAAEQSKYMMSEPEEALAAELNLSGANAWSKLQGTVTSQLTVDFELDGEVKKLPMPALINLHSHPGRIRAAARLRGRDESLGNRCASRWPPP